MGRAGLAVSRWRPKGLPYKGAWFNVPAVGHDDNVMIHLIELPNPLDFSRCHDEACIAHFSIAIERGALKDFHARMDKHGALHELPQKRNPEVMLTMHADDTCWPCMLTMCRVPVLQEREFEGGCCVLRPERIPLRGGRGASAVTCCRGNCRWVRTHGCLHVMFFFESVIV